MSETSRSPLHDQATIYNLFNDIQNTWQLVIIDTTNQNETKIDIKNNIDIDITNIKTNNSFLNQIKSLINQSYFIYYIISNDSLTNNTLTEISTIIHNEYNIYRETTKNESQNAWDDNSNNTQKNDEVDDELKELGFDIDSNEMNFSNSDNKQLFIYYVNNIKTFYEIYPFLCILPNKKYKKIKYNYPNSIIKNRLYLGDVYSARDFIIFEHLNIKYVINCTKEESNNFEHKNIKYLNIKIDDKFTENICNYFDKSCTFINNCIMDNNKMNNLDYKNISECLNDNNKSILIHCQAGISRSATIVISYLMKMNKINYQEAFEYVKYNRPCISPNMGFIEQLNKYISNENNQKLNKDVTTQPQSNECKCFIL